MEDLILNKNDQAVTTSVKVAEYFGKKHFHVVRDIEEIIQKGISNFGDTPMFAKSSYVNKQNHQEYPMYYMNKDGFTLLAMGFTGKKAIQFKMQYINAFNQMEEVIKDNKLDSYMIEDPVKRAKKWLKEYQRTAKLAQENKELKPKALFADAVATSKDTILVGELAKILKQNGLNMGAQRLFKWLRANGYLIKRRGSDYNVPTQKSMNMGLFRVKEYVHTDGIGTVKITKTPKVTGKGQRYFIEKLTGKEVANAK